MGTSNSQNTKGTQPTIRRRKYIMNILEQLDNLGNTANKTDSYWTTLVNGNAILNAEQATEFYREFQYSDNALTVTSMRQMQRESRQASIFKITGRVSHWGYTNGTDHITNAEIDEAQKSFTPLDVVTTKIKAKCSLTDDEMEDNIEGQNLQQTVLDEMGYRLGQENALWNFWGDTSISSATDDFLCAKDGWIKQSTNKIVSKDVDNSEGVFDLGNGVTTLFDALRTALPRDVYNSRQQLAYLCPLEVEDAYRNNLTTRQTQLGDTSVLNWDGLTYKGIPVLHSPALDETTCQTRFDGAPTVLSPINNLEYNIYKDTRVELKRDVDNETNEFHFRYRGCPSAVRTDAVCVGTISLDEKAEIQENNKIRPFYLNTISQAEGTG